MYFIFPHFLGSQNFIDERYLIENLIFLRSGQDLCSALGLESATYSRAHLASYRSFCFPSFSDPGPSSGVKPIPFLTQSMATQWYRTRITSTSLVAKEATSKSKNKGFIPQTSGMAEKRGLVIKSRWVFAIGVKNLIKPDPPSCPPAGDRLSRKSLSRGALQRLLCKAEV